MSTNPPMNFTPALVGLHTAARILALAHLGQLQADPATGVLTAASLTALWPAPPADTPAGAATPPDAPADGLPPLSAAAAAWWVDLLCRAELLTVGQGQYTPTRPAQDWLAQPAPLQLDTLRQTWWLNPLPRPAWLWPAARAPQPTQWGKVFLALCNHCLTLPAGQWTPLAQIWDALTAAGVFGPVGRLRNLTPVATAIAQQQRRMLVLVVTHLFPYLGLAEVRSSAHTWECCLPLTGQQWLYTALQQLRLWRTPPPEVAIEMTVPGPLGRLPASPFPPLTLDAALVGGVSAAAPAALSYHLPHCAELLDGPPLDPRLTHWTARYQVTAQSLGEAAVWGYTPEQVILLLGRYTGGEFPAAALAQLRDWQTTLTMISAAPGYYLTMPPATLQALRERKPFRERVRLVGGRQAEPRFTPQGAWVAQPEAAALWRYLRQQGFSVQVAPPPTSGNPLPLPHTALPVAPLLAALHTYQALRARLRGLADLHLEALIPDLAQALPIADRDAATHLVTSQRAVLDRALRPEDTELDLYLAEGERGRRGEELALSLPKGETRGGGEGEQRELSPQSSVLSPQTLPLAPCLLLTYVDAQARRTQRRVWPVRLEQRGGLVYLIARCELRGEERHFRLDRILAAEPVTE